MNHPGEGSVCMKKHLNLLLAALLGLSVLGVPAEVPPQRKARPMNP